jgi:hypothetical protein
MGKAVLKELIITLILCLAIILLIAVIMYEYAPDNKVIPEAVSYTAPQEATEVLKESVSEASQVLMTYQVNSTDITNAERVGQYSAGKIDPFSSYEESEEETTDGTTSSSSSSSQDSENNSDNTNDKTTSSSGKYFTDNGTK